MTATITSIAQTYNDGARSYCFHARTSTVGAGSLWTAKAAWWFVSQGGIVTKRHHGLELVHCSTYDGERIDLLIVDEAGTAEWATPVTTSVGSTFNFTAYADADSGNDSNDGLTISTPKLTLDGASGALSLFRGGNWSAGGEHRLFLQGTFSVSNPGSDLVWNANSAADGSGSELAGRMHFVQWAGQTQAQISITTDDGFASIGDDQGLVIDGVHIVGSYTQGGSAVSAEGITASVGSTGNDGYNLTVLNCEFRGFDFGMTLSEGAVAISEMGNGSFDWVVLDNVTFGSCYSTHCYFEAVRYLGFSNVDWGILNGAGTGASLRFLQASYWSVTDCSIIRTGHTWKGNVFRLTGGLGTDTWDRNQYGSVSGLTVRDTTECIEIEMPVDSGGRYVSDVWFHNLIWDAASTGLVGHMFTFTGSAGDSWDVIRFRATNCSGRGGESGIPTYLLRISQHSSATTEKIRSIRIDQCTWYQEQSQGFFTRDAVLCSAGGHADNYVDDSMEFYSNYAFCADTDANSPRCLWIIPSASAKIGGSDYNVIASSGTNTTTWSDADSLATWQGATAFDDNSFEITSASHNLTTVTALSFNGEPAADGTPSASLPQVRRGYPAFGYADADRYLRDASLPDAGAHEYGSGTLLSDPSFLTALETLLAVIDSRKTVSLSNVTFNNI